MHKILALFVSGSKSQHDRTATSPGDTDSWCIAILRYHIYTLLLSRYHLLPFSYFHAALWLVRHSSVPNDPARLDTARRLRRLDLEIRACNTLREGFLVTPRRSAHRLPRLLFKSQGPCCEADGVTKWVLFSAETGLKNGWRDPSSF